MMKLEFYLKFSKFVFFKHIRTCPIPVLWEFDKKIKIRVLMGRAA